MVPLCAQLQSSENFEHIGQYLSSLLSSEIMKGIIIISILLIEAAKGEEDLGNMMCDCPGPRDRTNPA